MNTIELIEYEVRWNGRTPLPEGLPTILCRSTDHEEVDRAYVESCLIAEKPYCFATIPKTKPRRFMSSEQVAKMRRARMEKRIRAKYGELFADELIQRELNDRPDYFSGADVDERTSILKAEEERILRQESLAMSPLEAIEFLRKQFVVPFISIWIEACHDLRMTKKWKPWMKPIFPVDPSSEDHKRMIAEIAQRAFDNENTGRSESSEMMSLMLSAAKRKKHHEKLRS